MGNLFSEKNELNLYNEAIAIEWEAQGLFNLETAPIQFIEVKWKRRRIR